MLSLDRPWRRGIIILYLCSVPECLSIKTNLTLKHIAFDDLSKTFAVENRREAHFSHQFFASCKSEIKLLLFLLSFAS